jgi:hypothetical protein
MDRHAYPQRDNDKTHAPHGPFLDEELFCPDDHSTIALERLEIYHAINGFIGFDDLQIIYKPGKEGFDKVFFSNIATLPKVSTSRSPFRFSLMIVVISYL